MASPQYRIVGALDTETTNYGDLLTGYRAVPILYQLGSIYADIREITPDNADKTIQVDTFRHHDELYKALDELIARDSFVSVILVHNLGFDMYALAPYLNAHRVRVLAKTAKKPISFQVLDDDGKPIAVFLDTLGLFMKSLKTLGDECGMPKASGDWDYAKIRTPDTPLTAQELHYAKRDIVTLICYMGYFLRRNPDIDPSDIGYRVQTKTGIVRAKRMRHVGNLKGKSLPLSVRQYWHLLNQTERPKTDDELFTMHASTRGGFTFCARANASKVYEADADTAILSYDSTSQHPAQMVSHLYPIHFKEATPEQLQIAFEIASTIKLDRILKHWLKPFPYAYYARFRIKGLRPRPGSIFEREGIFPLASARLGAYVDIYGSEQKESFAESMGEAGYRDMADNPTCAYGKIEAADEAMLFLTELDSWVISRCYEWDSVEAVSGYMSSTFRKASDMSMLSVMRFYAAKDAMKSFMSGYTEGDSHDVEGIRPYYAASLVERCATGDASYGDLREAYALSKADLNSLFGIEATNEARRDYELSDAGPELTGSDGLHNLPRAVKCDYQYGQRIVGWSRVAQTTIMELIAPYCIAIVCGDTDSVKIVARRDDVPMIENDLKRHASALDVAKEAACARIARCYKEQYTALDGIGHYVLDGEYDGLSAAWNKSYVYIHDGQIHVVLAGIPSSRRTEGKRDSYDDFLDALMDDGMSFAEVASLAVGYNVTIDHSITKLNARIHPQWGELSHDAITDCNGDSSMVEAPRALALFPAPKTIGDTTTAENAVNCAIARANNPHVNHRPCWLRWVDGQPTIER